MPTDMMGICSARYKCEGCGQTANSRKEMKKHIYAMRKDRNKSDKRNHR